MPASPNSLTTTAVPAPSGVDRKCRTRVVFPAPRNPVTTVTGIRAPRSRLSRRPNGPAVEEGKSSSMGHQVAVRRAFNRTRHGRAGPGHLDYKGTDLSNVQERPYRYDRDRRDMPGDDGFCFCSPIVVTRPGILKIHLQDI
jgi:hypothetical protein